MNQSAMGGIQQPPSHSTPLLANPPTHQILPHQSSTNVPPNNTNITSTAGQPNHQYTLSVNYYHHNYIKVVIIILFADCQWLSDDVWSKYSICDATSIES